MTASATRYIRRLPALLLVLTALGVAACGSNSSSSSAPAATSSSQTSTSSGGGAASTSSTAASSSNGIPQGPNAGDADSDNHGGPSDGDGNL